MPEHKKPESKQIELPVVGMHCSNCATNVENALKSKVGGVSDVRVSLATDAAVVTYDPDVATLSEMADAVGKIGFTLLLPSDDESIEDAQARAQKAAVIQERRVFAVGVAFTLPLFILSMGRDFGLLGPYVTAEWVHWVFFALATPVQFYTGYGYYVSGWRSIKGGAANMDVLVALGSSTAYFYSVAVLLFPALGEHVYFETSAMIITLIKLGKLLEARAKGNASSAIRKLIGLTPKKARRIDDVGEVHEVDIRVIKRDDKLQVRPGDAVPVDGEIIKGESSVDESMLTGEPIPRDKKEGSAVYAGTVNGQGLIVMKATGVGQETMLAHVINLVKSAQSSKAPIQRIADRVAAVFVPGIIVLALITFGAWWILGGTFVPAMIRMVAVLVIACPCAMGLATPTAIMVGAGKGASMGILFKSGEALERAEDANTIVLDKTGTLTKGKPELIDQIAAQGADADEVWETIASTATTSNHPISRAVLDGLKAKGVTVTQPDSSTAFAGYGVEANVKGRTVRMGKPDWFDDLPSEVQEQAQRFADEGKSLVAVTINGEYAALLTVADRIRSGAKEMVLHLKGLGVSPILLTGDNKRTAEAVAAQVGIRDVIADVLPDQKEKVVREHQNRGRTVVMVGDGINDAPALARADIGMAIGAGAEVALEASDITLVQEDLALVPRALALSRATMRTIRQNLFWAFFYNVALIPLAAGVFTGIAALPQFITRLHPAMAAGAMAFSSVTVVLNSIRLSRKAI